MQITISENMGILLDKYAKEKNTTIEEAVDSVFIEFFSNNADILKSTSEFIDKHIKAFKELAK